MVRIKSTDPSGALVRYLEALPLTAEQRDQALELVADIHLANVPADGEYPVRSETQLQRQRRRELALRDVAQPEDLVRRVEDAAMLEAALRELTRDERACFVLSLARNTHPQIAIALGISERTVRLRIQAARQKLDTYRETVQKRGAE